jgi:hypothetical protein
MLKFKEGQKSVIIRYGKNIISDCIEKHMETIKENGYCWFGKIGVVPSKKVMDAVLAEDTPIVVLYSNGLAYIAALEEISLKQPDKGYPEYYQAELFEKLIYPKSYYKFTSIKKMTKEDLDKLRVVSSGSYAITTLSRSMSSFFYVEYEKTRVVIERKEKKQPKKKKEKAQVAINDCVYKKDGKCNKKGFVSFQFECKRPSSCMGQKR